MIRRFESAHGWIELIGDRYSPTGYIERELSNEQWKIGSCINMETHIHILSLMGWKEVKSGFDPNDLQGIDTALWGTNSKPCCGGGTNGGLYVQGKWHDADCDSLKPVPQASLPGYSAPQASIPQPTNLGRCTCGSTSVGSDRHSHYCDLATSGRR